MKTEYEKDLEFAHSYLTHKDADYTKLKECAARLIAYTEVVPDCPNYATIVSALRRAADKLNKQAADLQASLLDSVRLVAGFKTDCQLAQELDIHTSTLSCVRHGNMPVGATVIIRIHEITDWSVRDIKGRLNMECLPSLKP